MVTGIENWSLKAGSGTQGDADEPWPVEVELILSAIDAGAHGRPPDRRAMERQCYRVRGWLHLFSDSPDGSARVIYTRDLHQRGLGFITPHRLPLGYGGRVSFPRPDGSGTLSVHCTLLRCREAAPGWYEGSLYFNREQPQLLQDASPGKRTEKEPLEAMISAR